MATIRFGNIITGAAGKIGGTIIQRGRSGSQMRNLTKPIPARSNASAQVHARFQAIAGIWRGLTVSQRQSWTDLADTLTRFNRLGDPYTPSGQQIFTEFSLNQRIVRPQGTLISAPTLEPQPDIFNVRLEGDHNPADYQIRWDYVDNNLSWKLCGYLIGFNNSGAQMVGRTPIFSDLSADPQDEALDLTSPAALQYPLTKSTGLTWIAGYRLLNYSTGQGTPFAKLSTVLL
jgi:hypothetical protein